MPSQPPRVGIVTPHQVVARGLAAMLGEHPDRALIADLPDVDVVLYDVIGLHHGDGADLADLQRRVRVLAVVRDLRPDLRARAVTLGAHGCVSMGATAEQLVQEIEAVVAGEPLRAQSDGEPLARLTDREAEVLALVTRGLSNNEIAERLYLSINSVKTYIRSAYAKIGVSSRTRAVAWCLVNGFAPPDA